MCSGGGGGGAAAAPVCAACGTPGCSPGCSDAVRLLVAPPGAHCVPRGPSLFFGWNLGLGGGRPAGAGSEGPAAAGAYEYWRRLLGMATWQAGMWFFGLLVVVMAVASGAARPVASVEDYVRVRHAARRAGLLLR
jgi:hypothetical protein